MSTPLRRTPAMLAVLRTLINASEPLWGLRVSRLAGRPTGSVYPLLDRLEKAGYVASQWETDTVSRTGPRRRLYWLTPAGEEWARSRVANTEPVAPRPRPSWGATAG